MLPFKLVLNPAANILKLTESLKKSIFLEKNSKVFKLLEKIAKVSIFLEKIAKSSSF